MTSIRVGTCGYQYYNPGESWQDEYRSKLHAYSEQFDAVELNRTFYTLPQVSTAERWRRETVNGFTFTLKAWQALTHTWSSPTWNNYRDDVPRDRTDELGYLRPTPFVRRAWERTMERALAVDAEFILLQTPPSFGYSEEHAQNMRSLLAEIDRNGIRVGWEPRGSWRDHPDQVESVCADLDLIHVVDIMREEPLLDQSILYTRLHGLNEDRFNYDYDYSDQELSNLARTLRDAADQHQRVYCMFNNYEMYSNAQALQSRL